MERHIKFVTSIPMEQLILRTPKDT